MASLTPDPKKRSFLLPAGCKDLHDLFKSADKQGQDKMLALQQWDAAQIQRKKININGPLSDVKRFITMLSESESPFSYLFIAIPNEELSVDINQGTGKAIRVNVYVQMGTEREKTVQAFFVRHNLQMPVDSSTPSQFILNLPVHQRYDIVPLSPEVHDIALIVTAFFHEVAGLDENSTLCFCYDVATKAV